MSRKKRRTNEEDERCPRCGGDMVTNPCAHITYCPRCRFTPKQDD